MDLPRLELDHPFTYLAPEEVSMGARVSIPFHGRTVKGWVLGPTDDVPARVMPVRRVLSRVALFDERLLELYRWVSERYVVPLSTVIGRAHPPRVASEEEKGIEAAPASLASPRAGGRLGEYDGGEDLLRACREGGGAFAVQPLPDHEAGACLDAVRACLSAGRDAIVVVPEADPLPETARLVAEEVGGAALVFAGGDRRARYRAWLGVLGGRHRVVVGTRLSVFAPLARLGLVWVNREAHPGHREERAPYHHVREVALARGRIGSAVAVLAGHCLSAEAAALAEDGELRTVRAARAEARRSAPLVQTIRPEREELGAGLSRAVRKTDGAFLLVSRRGGGIARVCRTCGEPARCSLCSGAVILRGGKPVCAVCGADAACPRCAGVSFGVEPGGTEHVAERAGGLAGLPARVVEESGRAVAPGPGSVLVGTPAAVKDFGPLRVGLVGILDADMARRRPGLAAPEQSLATWMEAAIWAGPKGAGGRVIVQTSEPSDPAVQALVRWDPAHFHRHERRRRAESGFPPGHPVFRVRGGTGLADGLRALGPVTLLTSSEGDLTVCLITLRPDAVASFGDWVRATPGLVDRVEAEPQL